MVKLLNWSMKNMKLNIVIVLCPVFLYICSSFIELSTNKEQCSFLGKIQLVEFKKGGKKHKLIPRELGDISIIAIRQKKCKINNNILNLQGYTISQIGEKRLYDITGDFLDSGLKTESNILILSLKIMDQERVVIGDTLAISDSNGYFDLKFNLAQNQYICLVHKDKKRNASIYYGTWSHASKELVE